MIVFPKNWNTLGIAISLKDIDIAMRAVIADIDTDNLSFSGGVDSSLLMYYLLEAKRKVRAFTVANTEDHPDIEYSQKSIKYFKEKYGVHIDHSVFIRPKLEGDDLVRAFYSALKPFVHKIIAGDCIDELCCGYYMHQDLKETTYQYYLQRLQSEQLQPLNDNSGDIEVYLPYADDRVANLFYRIPLFNKASILGRKLIIMRLAEDRILPEVIERRKYGFATNIAKSPIQEETRRTRIEI